MGEVIKIKPSTRRGNENKKTKLSPAKKKIASNASRRHQKRGGGQGALLTIISASPNAQPGEKKR